MPPGRRTVFYSVTIHSGEFTGGAPPNSLSDTPSTVTGCASGMTFHFSPYGVGPYAEGPYTAFLPFSAIEPYLTDEAKAAFAGERLKSDEDE